MPVKSDSPLGRRQHLHEERLKRIATPGMVKVLASTEAVRRLIRHPRGVAFRSNIGEAVEWPRDSFTTRRIADGTVYVEGQAAPSRQERGGDDGLTKRERVAARKPKPAAAPFAPPVPPAPSEPPKQRPATPPTK